MRFLPVNLDTFLVELANLDQTLALLDSLQADPIAGVAELIPAARTIMVRFDPAVTDANHLRAAMAGRDIHRRVERAGQLVEIPVRYDGEDLDEVAAMLGLTREQVIERHAGSIYSVAFTGFAPGFAYLSGGHPDLDVPRRSTPRTRIPAGAVGLAGTFSGVYPKASPGGWQIIGVTDVPMWDLSRAVPALLQPGSRVRFVPDDGRIAVPAAALQPATSCNTQPDPQLNAAGSTPALRVRQPGLQAVFQDSGRHGHAGQGVSASGAMDQAALRLANRLVGNASDEAGIELAYGGFDVEALVDGLVVAVTGADAPLELVAPDGRRWPVANHRALALSAGDRLVVGQPHAGMRAYLAVRGGFDLPAVLGSRATDTLAQVGPSALAAGDTLVVRAVTQGCIVGEPTSPRSDLPRSGEVVTLDVVLGPRTDWFTDDAIGLLQSQPWLATQQSNRVGIRLQGDVALTRAIAGELPSEGTAAGAIQVPPSGQPVLFLADHPLTGGYPVIGCVAPYHLDLAGQIPAGALVRFNPIAAFEPVVLGD